MDEIDFVIAWVDGSDRALARRRASALSDIGEVSSSGGNKRRWQDMDEISLCLASIETFAPWVRKIWIVTDGQQPPMDAISSEFAKRVEIVDHTVIFRGHESLLPTFNSLSIGLMLWRIPGLAEQFVYFNDDCFISSPLHPEECFINGVPVLRGEFVAFEEVPSYLHIENREAGARLAGVTGDQYFSRAHVAISLNVSTLADFFAARPGLLERQARPKFRESWQASVGSLHAALSIQQNRCSILEGVDWNVLSVTDCHKFAPHIRERLSQFGPHIAFGCINDLRRASLEVPRLIDEVNSTLGIQYPLKRRVLGFPGFIWRALLNPVARVMLRGYRLLKSVRGPRWSQP